MTLIFSALLFSLSANLDNIVVGMAYGVKKIKIGLHPNLMIALLTSIGTLISMTIGKIVLVFLPKYLENLLGALIIIFLGLYFTVQSIIKLKTKKTSRELALKDINEMIIYAEKSDIDKSGDINIKEALLVGLGLTLNNFGTGIAASLTGVNIYLTVIMTFIVSLLAISLGERIGKKLLGKLIGDYAPFISGALLIILGIIELIF